MGKRIISAERIEGSEAMKKAQSIGLITGLLLAAALLGLALAMLFPLPDFPYHMPPMNNPPSDQVGPPGDIEIFYTAKTVISIVNVALLVVLLGIHIKIYQKVKSKFTVGLIIVMFTLLMYALTSNPLLHEGFGFRAGGLGPFAMLPDLFTAVALVSWLYLSLE